MVRSRRRLGELPSDEAVVEAVLFFEERKKNRAAKTGKTVEASS